MTELDIKLSSILYEPRAHRAGFISGFCSVKRMRVFDSSWIRWDTNPSQVMSQQTLVLIYRPLKDGKLSWLRRERKSHKSVQTLATPGIDL